jgi:sulfur carrier protein ThiS
MKLTMQVEWQGKVHQVEKRMTVQKLLEVFSLSREAHLVTANGTLVTEDQMLGLDDRVKIIRVISGG